MPKTSRVDTRIVDLLQHSARDHSDSPALLAPERQAITYSELASEVERVAGQLAGLGIHPEHRVALVLPNGPETAAAFLAVASCATCAPLNPAYRTDEFAFYLSDLNVRAVIVEADSESPVVEAACLQGVEVLRIAPVPGGAAGSFEFVGVASSSTAPHFGRAEDVALILHTSGTTARPKIVPLTHANLCASAKNVRDSLHLTAADRCLNVMPLFHIHGLIAGTLASIAAGASVVCPPAFSAPDFFTWLKLSVPTWYTAVPTMHQAILARAAENAEVIQERPLRFIRSSSAALPPQVLRELEAAFHAPVVEAYGMTEATHQIACNPLPPAVRKPGTVGIAAGPEIAIRSDDGRLLPPGEVGEIVIRGPNVTLGYANNPNANAEAFPDGWFRTGDQGRLDHEGYLTITGRLKEIINRGGEKIAPREIDEVLLDHPAVAQAVTFPAPHVQLGEEVAAAVVLRAGRSATEAELSDFVGERLAYFKVPTRLLIVDEIPRGATGKIQRITLARTLGLTARVSVPRARAEGPRAAPRTELEAELVSIWEEVLRMRGIGIDEYFLDLGGDSLMATRIAGRVGKRFALNIPVSTIFATQTIAGLAGVIAAQRSKQEDMDFEDLLAEMESMSDEEAARMLQSQESSGQRSM